MCARQFSYMFVRGMGQWVESNCGLIDVVMSHRAFSGSVCAGRLRQPCRRSPPSTSLLWKARLPPSLPEMSVVCVCIQPQPSESQLAGQFVQPISVTCIVSLCMSLSSLGLICISIFGMDCGNRAGVLTVHGVDAGAWRHGCRHLS